MKSESMIQPVTPTPSKTVFSWALNDWANHGFVTTVMAVFFPIFYEKFWRPDQDGIVTSSTRTFELGLFNSLAGLIVALAAPALGAIADRGGAKKRFLLFFACVGILGVSSLYFAGPGMYHVAGLGFMVAIIGYLAANIFSDSMLIDMSRGRSTDKVSALSFAMGYLGGGTMFAFNVLLTLKPELFGLPNATAAVRASFLIVAVWWIIFMIPLILYVPESKAKESVPVGTAIKEGLKQLAETFHHVRRLKHVMWFLVAYWIYIDAVNTVVVMAVQFGQSLGFAQETLTKALLLVQFVGFPAAIIFGRIGHRIGSKKAILIGLVVYTLATIWGSQMKNEREFYGRAIASALVMGGVQSLSRSYYAKLIPQDKATEFFGFYNMLGRFATIVGPFLMGYTARLTGSDRAAILSLSVLFILGAVLLAFVPSPPPESSDGGVVSV
jgi:MFS transporter, UMF1 family